MKPASFRYHRPESLEAALALLAEHGDAARPIAGGQSLVPMMNLRLAQPAELVDIGELGELRTIDEADGTLRIGALVRHHEIETSARVRACGPLLTEAAPSIGHYAIRQRGTLGGSLAHADPAAQWPLIAATLGARIEAASARGRRSIEAADFFVAVVTTALEPDELIVSVRFPLVELGEGWGFRSFERRQGDFAIVSAAATLAVSDGRVRRLRLGIGGAGPTPAVLGALAQAQAGRTPDDAWAAEVSRAARDALDIQDDARIPAVYRRELIEVMVRRALDDARARAGEAR